MLYDRFPIGIALLFLPIAANVLASDNKVMSNDPAIMACYTSALEVC